MPRKYIYRKFALNARKESEKKIWNIPAALIVVATKASLSESFIRTQAKFITKGIDKQWAFGLKSLPKQTITPIYLFNQIPLIIYF